MCSPPLYGRVTVNIYHIHYIFFLEGNVNFCQKDLGAFFLDIASACRLAVRLEWILKSEHRGAERCEIYVRP